MYIELFFSRFMHVPPFMYYFKQVTCHHYDPNGMKFGKNPSNWDKMLFPHRRVLLTLVKIGSDLYIDPIYFSLFTLYFALIIE